jgi:hypothetical protein
MLARRRAAVPVARRRSLIPSPTGASRPAPSPARIREALARAGLPPATAIPPASAGRAEEATIQPAALAEGTALQAFAVGAPEPWPGTAAFLDGTQRSEVVAYAGSSPLLVATVRAAVLEREDRRLRAVVLRERLLCVGRRAGLDAAGEALAGLDRVELDDSQAAHPVRDLVQAGQAIDEARGALEREAGLAYREQRDGWLVVDGSLAEFPAAGTDRRMVAVSKSHSTLPFDGEELERYLRLPAGHRSSIFTPASRRFVPVRAWALRLWPWEGRDLLHGLVRVEVAPGVGTPERADELSRWLLAERAPVSAPDKRWDRLLYGVRRVEEFLRARD